MTPTFYHSHWIGWSHNLRMKKMVASTQWLPSPLTRTMSSEKVTLSIFRKSIVQKQDKELEGDSDSKQCEEKWSLLCLRTDRGSSRFSLSIEQYNLIPNKNHSLGDWRITIYYSYMKYNFKKIILKFVSWL